jgi:hypothetical protein
MKKIGVFAVEILEPTKIKSAVVVLHPRCSYLKITASLFTPGPPSSQAFPPHSRATTAEGQAAI